MDIRTNKIELGAVKIHRDVIISIASIAALEIKGVKQIGITSPVSGIIELFGFKGVPAIKVEFNKNDEIRLEVPLIVKYGYSVPEIVEKVQENIRQALETMLDKSARDIQISIQGIEKG